MFTEADSPELEPAGGNLETRRRGDHVVEITDYAASRGGARIAEEGSGRRTTTTNATPRGAGSPRFVLGGARADESSGVAVEHVLLTGETTTFGSDPGADVTLAGLEPIHATVHHTVADEYVLVLQGPADTSGRPSVRYHGEPAYALRHGFEVRMGEWVLVYQRDEYADHGRPFGGREGGEWSIQTRQHPRVVPHPEVTRYEVPGD